MADASMELDWRPQSAWADLLVPGRTGFEDGPAGLRVTPIEKFSLAMAIADARAPAGALAQRLREAHGVAPPERIGAARGRSLDLIWFAPQQWLAVSADAGAASALKTTLDGLAAVTDQSDGRGLLRVSGRRVRDGLAKGFPIDLHDSVFPVGAAAATVVSYINVHIWRVADDSADASFVIAVPRSFCASFRDWLKASAAEHGCEVLAPERYGRV